MKLHLALFSIVALAAAGCSTQSPTQPLTRVAGPTRSATTASGRTAPGQPGYEQAYVANQTVTINAIEVPNVAPSQAQADFYEAVYPPDWQALGIAPPQCNPCDHDGNGIDELDFHDHVLDSAPGINGYRGLWHVWAIVPAYNGNASHDAAIGALYKAALPLKSEDALLAFAGQHLPSGAPVAVKVDTHFYFLCAVVNANAMK